MKRIDPDSPVTFRDFITSDYPVRDMTEEEFEALPFTTHMNWDMPKGWEKTGYRSPHSLLVGHDNIIYWILSEFKGVEAVECDMGGAGLRYDTDQFIIHIDGKPVFQRVNAYAKELTDYVA